MKVFIFFGFLANLIEYATIRIYCVWSEKKSVEECFCTINILDTINNTEKRWMLDRQLDYFCVLLQILIAHLPSVLVDSLNCKQNNRNKYHFEGIDLIQQIFLIHYVNDTDCIVFHDDCVKFLNMLCLFKAELEYDRFLECNIIIGELLYLAQKLFTVTTLFNNFVSEEMIHILNYTYTRKKADKKWNLAIKKTFVQSDLFLAFEKKIL
jgi:hypothetical protein